MAIPPGRSGSIVGLLKRAFHIIWEYGAGINIINLFMQELNLTRKAAGQLYKLANEGIKAAMELRGLPPGQVLDPSKMPIDPNLFGRNPLNRRFEYRVLFNNPFARAGRGEGFVSVSGADNLTAEEIVRQARQQLADTASPALRAAILGASLDELEITIVGVFRDH